MKESQLRQKYLKILTTLLPVGAIGVSLLLGSAAQSEANSAQRPPDEETGASQRLAAIREAISTIGMIEPTGRAQNPRLAWWGNGGWRNGGWRNGGWGNGGWHDWGNGWHNGWLNW